MRRGEFLRGAALANAPEGVVRALRELEREGRVERVGAMYRWAGR